MSRCQCEGHPPQLLKIISASAVMGLQLTGIHLEKYIDSYDQITHSTVPRQFCFFSIFRSGKVSLKKNCQVR